MATRQRQLIRVAYYTAPGCGPSALIRESYSTVDHCANGAYAGEQPWYLILTCNLTGQATVTKYSDSHCSTIDTSYTGVSGFVNGKFSDSGTCHEIPDELNLHQVIDCTTSNTVTFNYYDDSLCDTPHTGADAIRYLPVDRCNTVRENLTKIVVLSTNTLQVQSF
jgi:hypothetical protein